MRIVFINKITHEDEEFFEVKHILRSVNKDRFLMRMEDGKLYELNTNVYEIDYVEVE